MKVLSRLVLALSALVPFAVPAQAAGDDPARVMVVHGIPGDDLGLDRALPVDVSVDGAVILAGFEFGEFAGPLDLPAGTYNIEIRLANADDPGTNDPPVIAGDFSFDAGEFASVVAHFDADMGLTASKFTNDFSYPGFLRSRALIHHTAAAPEVDISLRRLGFFPDGAFLEDVPNGAQANLSVLFGFYDFGVNVANTDVQVLGGRGLLLPRFAYLAYVVGSAETGSLQIITKRVYLRR